MLKPIYYGFADGEQLVKENQTYIGGQVAKIGSDGKVALYNGEGTPVGLFRYGSNVGANLDAAVKKATYLKYGDIAIICPEKVNGEEVSPYVEDFANINPGDVLFATAAGKLSKTGTVAIAHVDAKDAATKGLKVTIVQPNLNTAQAGS